VQVDASQKIRTNGIQSIRFLLTTTREKLQPSQQNHYWENIIYRYADLLSKTSNNRKNELFFRDCVDQQYFFIGRFYRKQAEKLNFFFKSTQIDDTCQTTDAVNVVNS
jgi:hypothetical protein